MRQILFLYCLGLLLSCQSKENTANDTAATPVSTAYAKGFNITDKGTYKILEVADYTGDNHKKHTYLLIKRGVEKPKGVTYDQKIRIPLEKIAATSTSHIPYLETLQEEKTLIGFPNPEYISSDKTRRRIERHEIADIGENEYLNLEVLLSIRPQALIGFTVDKDNKIYRQIEQSRIPVIYNNEWKEQNPLGKAEWIKFFGALFDKDKLADSIFNQIERDYLAAKKLAANSKSRPVILTGALYKDIWHMPGGNSWAAQLIHDAGGNYVYAGTKETGSLSLSFETVLNDAREADIWINPNAFTTYRQMEKSSVHYKQFRAFQHKNIYGFSDTTGPTGGIIYFESGPLHPDRILKDLIHIFHPELLPDYQSTYYKPLR